MAPPITIEQLAQAKRALVVAEATACTLMLDFEDQEIEASKHAISPMAGVMARSMIALDVGQAMGWSENQVRSRMFVARTVRERAPLAWAAFSRGLIEFPAVREIASTIDRLTEPESVTELDSRVIAYASSHTTAELRRWLRRFVERVEADQAVARAEAEREKRYVRVDHVDDGMAYLTAYLPSPMASAIERRLDKESRKQPKDGRTLVQKQADLTASWLTTNEAGEAAVNADICVKIDADILAGAREGFAESADGAWSAPASWIAELAKAGNPFWYRMVAEPVTDDILSIEYKGRFAPKLLRKALEIRDGTCAVDGCLTPAWKCEVDHKIPWPRGQTTARNSQLLSKAHHGQKGHGLTPARRAPRSRSLTPDFIFVEYAPAA